MPPKQTKAEKKAASQAKRKATLERKRAEQQAAGEGAAEPQAPVASEGTPVPAPATPEPAPAAPEPAPATPEPSANVAGKKRVTISDADTEPPRKRQRPVAETGSVAGSDQQDGNYEPQDERQGSVGSMVGPGYEEPTLDPPSASKSKGKGKSAGPTKKAERIRSAALAGPRPKIPKSKGVQAQEAANAIMDRSLAVNLDDRQIITNTRLIWEVCERCAVHLGDSEYTPHVRVGCATVLTYVNRSHLHWQ